MQLGGGGNVQLYIGIAIWMKSEAVRGATESKCIHGMYRNQRNWDI